MGLVCYGEFSKGKDLKQVNVTYSILIVLIMLSCILMSANEYK